MNVNIKIIKKADADKRRAEEIRLQILRTEVAMLRLLMEKYPTHAAKFVEQLQINR